MSGSATGGMTACPLAARVLASSDWRATEFGKLYEFGSLGDGTNVCTPTTSPLLSTSGIPMHPVLVTTMKRAAPGLADAVHFTGGWLAHEEAVAAAAPSTAKASADSAKRQWFTEK